VAQAASNPITRRSALAGAVALVPAAIAAAHAAERSSRDPAQEAGLRASFSALNRAETLTVEAETKFAAWLADHPEPHLGQWEEGDRASEKAVVYAYTAARSNWKLARSAAMRDCGLAQAMASLHAASQQHDAACARVADLKARSLPDLIAKALLCEWDNAQEWIASSVIDDLLVLDNA
jgi:hypothetical protein